MMKYLARIHPDQMLLSALKTALVPAAILIITGCAHEAYKGPTQLYEGPTLRATEVTVVIPSSHYDTGSRRTSSVSVGGVTIRRIEEDRKPKVYFIEFDGQPIPGKGNTPIEFRSGRHAILCRLHGPGTDRTEFIEVDFERSRVYSITPHFDGEKWVAELNRYAPLSDYRYLRKPDPALSQ